MKIFFTGDTHFGHENVMRFDGRPFKSVEEMDCGLIRRWNAKVDKGDLVIFGHTPTIHFQNVRPWSIWKSDEAIGIDCGCGYPEGRLACLRLDDMMEFYSK